jgi:serine phosphatase RsbU (regulator of sigma subunit)
MKIIFFAALLFNCLNTLIYSQKGFNDASRANYIFDIIKYVEWLDEEQIDTFRVGVLDNDKELLNVMKKEAGTRQRLHNKPIKISLFKDLSSLTPLEALYVHKNSGFDIYLINQAIKNTHTLLMSENYPFHKSMINFIVIKGKRHFEINQARMKEAGLNVSRLFAAHAVKSEDDWHEIYNKTEEELQKEKQTVLEQKELIKDQKKHINDQLETIKDQKEQISIQNGQINKQKNELKNLEKSISAKQKDIEKQIAVLNKQKREIAGKETRINAQKQEIDKQIETINNQNDRIKKQKATLKTQDVELQRQKIIMALGGIMLLLALVVGFLIFLAYRIKKKSNKVLEEKNIEIERQRNIAESQRDKIAYQNEQIIASINYAQKIQRAILPGKDRFKECLNNFFILYKPKDIVSGDFYWESRVHDDVVIVAADCTGHGVPGAFMSMLGVTFLNEIVNSQGIVQPDEILNILRNNIIKSLNQDGREHKLKDGMDMAVCTINKNSKSVKFAGANNPMILIRQGELEYFKGDKMPVSLHEKMLSFTYKEIALKDNDCIYIFSDGYADQFGGDNNKKFKIRNLKEALLSVYQKPMTEQHIILDKTFEDWKGSNEQIDDVLMLGIKI